MIDNKDKIELIIKNCLELESKVNYLNIKLWIVSVCLTVLITLFALGNIPSNKNCDKKNNSIQNNSYKSCSSLDFVLFE